MTDVYPVGLFADWKHCRLRWALRYMARQVRWRNWRALRTYFSGFLAEHEGHPHDAGKGWTRRAATRRAQRLCEEAARHGTYSTKRSVP